MSNEKMREEFEAWYTKILKRQEENLPKYCVSTLRFSKEVLWEGWKASREELVIELPLTKDLGFGEAGKASADTWNGAMMAVASQLESHGMKVKS